MAAKRRGASGGPAGMLIGLLLAGTVLFGFIKGNDVRSLSDAINVFRGEAPSVEQFLENLIGDGFTWPDGSSGTGQGTGDLGSGSGTAAPDVDPASAITALGTLTVADHQKVDYNRDEWRHWDNITSCWTVREQVLYRQAEPGTATLLDKNKQPVSDVSKACEITGGVWVDPYTGKEFTNPRDLDIDHVIPLGYAARHGGQGWNSDKKREYANSLDEGHLLAVFSSANRQKGDKGPADWKPQSAYQCTYAMNWISVAGKWNLSITKADSTALKDMLATC